MNAALHELVDVLAVRSNPPARWTVAHPAFAARVSKCVSRVTIRGRGLKRSDMDPVVWTESDERESWWREVLGIDKCVQE